MTLDFGCLRRSDVAMSCGKSVGFRCATSREHRQKSIKGGADGNSYESGTSRHDPHVWLCSLCSHSREVAMARPATLGGHPRVG